jgi:hypothetical protein
MTDLARAVDRVGTTLFPESLWMEISNRVALAFRMTEAEAEAFRSHRIAKLIAALPFLAGCEDAERTAVAHLGSYLLSIRETKAYFNARPADDASPLERLRLGTYFKGGDQRIIERGLCLLALDMVFDYQRDIEEDRRLGKYNPVASGAWDFKDTVANLEYKVISVACPAMDEILPIEITPMAYWGTPDTW